MKKTKKIIIVAALVVFALITGIVGYNKIQKKDAKPKGMFAIYIDEGDGNGPVASTSSVWPTEGYELDLETSFCDNGSVLSWDNTNKTVGVEATTGDKCKLYFTKLALSYLYSQETIASGTLPINGSDTNSYTNTAYIRTTVNNGVAVEHNACLNYNGGDFCFGPNYWVSGDSDGSQTLGKLQIDMEGTLKTSASSCNTNRRGAYCNFNSFSCITYSYGDGYCFQGNCMISISGGELNCSNGRLTARIMSDGNVEFYSGGGSN